MSTLTTERPSEQSEGEADDQTVRNSIYHANFAFDVISAEESGDQGVVEAIVSAFDIDYRMGFITHHRITQDAFQESIASQSTIPIFFQHNWDWSEQPPIGTGVASTVTEPKPGLKVVSSFFLDTESGRSTFRAIKAGALREWSIGYRIQDFEIQERDDGKRVIVVKRAELWEASSVLRGANPDTETLKVARQMPPELTDALNTIAGFMQSSKEAFDAIQARLIGLESAHEVLVGSLEDGGFKVAEGEQVEPAVGGDSEAGPQEAAPESPPAPSSPEAKGLTEADLGPDRIDRAFERAIARVSAKWEAFVEQAGAGLDSPEAAENSRQDIAAMERVLRCLNGNKYRYEACERTATARVLAESAKS